MVKLHKFLSRKNVFGSAFILALFLIICYGFFPLYRNSISNLIFNPFWPATLGLLEIYIQTVEKETAKKNEDKIKSAGAILRAAHKSLQIDDKINRLLLEALNGDDLIQKSRDELDMEKIEEDAKKASEINKKEENINNF